MNYIGEFTKDSTILLELVTKDENNQPIATDFPPTATIEHYDRNGIVEVDSVTLITMEDTSRHTYVYQVPIDWKYGDYTITYKVQIDEEEYTTKEKFYLSRVEDLVQESNQVNYEILNLIRNQSEINPVEPTEPIEEPVTSSESLYIMPPEFQTQADIQVVNNKIIIRPKDSMKYNHTYRVVLDKEIRSISGNRLGEGKTITFTSEYQPLFATPLEVQSIIRGLYRYFTPHDIYLSIRDAGQKAHQLKGLIADPNNARYRPLTDRDPTYFALTKYVLYEASRTLLSSLIIRILDGSDNDEEIGVGMINEMGGSISLGDFSISDKSSSSSGIGGETKKDDTPLKKLQALMHQVEKDLKFWMDAMMGRNRRGYASPISASFRTAAGSPEGRDFE